MSLFQLIFVSELTVKKGSGRWMPHPVGLMLCSDDCFEGESSWSKQRDYVMVGANLPLCTCPDLPYHSVVGRLRSASAEFTPGPASRYLRIGRSFYVVLVQRRQVVSNLNGFLAKQIKQKKLKLNYYVQVASTVLMDHCYDLTNHNS